MNVPSTIVTSNVSGFFCFCFFFLSHQACAMTTYIPCTDSVQVRNILHLLGPQEIDGLLMSAGRASTLLTGHLITG